MAATAATRYAIRHDRKYTYVPYVFTYTCGCLLRNGVTIVSTEHRIAVNDHSGNCLRCATFIFHKRKFSISVRSDYIEIYVDLFSPFIRIICKFFNRLKDRFTIILKKKKKKTLETMVSL